MFQFLRKLYTITQSIFCRSTYLYKKKNDLLPYTAQRVPYMKETPTKIIIRA